MGKAATMKREESVQTELKRVYEVGYTIAPSTGEENVEKVVDAVRSAIEKLGGSFIAEGAPSLIRLAYPISVHEAGRRVAYERGFFGWIKFESAASAANELDDALKRNAALMRYIIFKTVRGDTRTNIRVPVLREVKRSDTLRTAPRYAGEPSTPVSEEELEKALQDITTD